MKNNDVFWISQQSLTYMYLNVHIVHGISKINVSKSESLFSRNIRHRPFVSKMKQMQQGHWLSTMTLTILREHFILNEKFHSLNLDFTHVEMSTYCLYVIYIYIQKGSGLSVLWVLKVSKRVTHFLNRKWGWRWDLFLSKKEMTLLWPKARGLLQA